MELTSKQRAYLRGQANGLDVILYVGLDGVNPGVVRQAEEALTAREMIKGTVQENAPVTAREACEELAARTGAQGVQVIGRRFVLYRENPDPAERKYTLPGEKKRK